MRSTTQIHGDEAREALKRGIDAVYNAVAPTLGAKGRNVVYERWNSPVVTNDGVSIAREVLPEDKYEYLGAELIKQAAERTNDEAADGTTTTIILTKELIDAGFHALQEGENPMLLRREIQEAKDFVVAEIKKRATPAKNLLEVAKISVENDEIAELVADVVQHVGALGSVIVEEGHTFKTEVEKVKGYWFEKGYISPYMITNEKNEAVLEECAVILTDRTLNLNNDLIGVLTDIAKTGTKSLLLIADKIEGELLQTLIANKMQGRFTTVAVTRPLSTEELEDIATLTGATAITKDKGIKDIAITHVGKAPKAIIKKDQTIIIGHDTQELKDRIKTLSDIVKDSKEKYGEIERQKERLARLTGGLAVIRVGAKTEAERGYLKLKVDDAVGACKSASEEGIVAGGGTTLRDIASEKTFPTTKGAIILKSVLSTPFERLMENSGISEYDIKKNYNVLTGDIIKDMKKAGVVDPAKVSRCAVENAVSAATTVLTTETVIATKPELPIDSLKKLLS